MSARARTVRRGAEDAGDVGNGVRNGGRAAEDVIVGTVVSGAARRAAARGNGARKAGARMSPARLMAEAEIARRTSYAPYSKFRVGAALLTDDGTVVHGCNVENASYGLSICAERNAMWKAVSQGLRRFVAVAVTAEPRHGSTPCGACRQVLHEFAPDLDVYWRAADGGILTAKIERLLAQPFRLLRAPGRVPAPRAGKTPRAPRARAAVGVRTKPSARIGRRPRAARTRSSAR